MSKSWFDRAEQTVQAAVDEAARQLHVEAAMTDTERLVEFVLAQIADDEAAVRALYESPLDAQLISHRPIQTWVMQYPSVEIAEMARRVLAECAAKRAIVELHAIVIQPVAGWGDDAPTQSRDLPVCKTCAASLHYGYPVEYPCMTLRLLAQPYADHPDFDPAWKVEP